MPHLALFDFDGTITHKDSLWHFLKFLVRRKWVFYWKIFLLSPVLIKLKMGWLSAHQAKERVLFAFLSAHSLASLEEKAKHYAHHILPQIVRPQALLALQKHLALGHRVFIISASPTLWLAPWCEQQRLGLVATELSFVQEKFAGLGSPNCNGEEKVRRIRQILDLDAFECIYAYGDSEGDEPMLAMAHQKFYRYF